MVTSGAIVTITTKMICKLSHICILQHAQDKNCIANLDLTEYHHLLDDQAISIYNCIVKLSQEQVQPLIGM